MFRWELGTVHRLTALAARRNLTLREFVVLAELSRWPHGLANAQICGITGLPSATVAALLRTLDRRGFVDRGPDPDDARQVNSAVTDAGRAHLGDLVPSSDEVEHLLYGTGQDQFGAVTLFLRVAGDRGYEGARRIRDPRIARW